MCNSDKDSMTKDDVFFPIVDIVILLSSSISFSFKYHVNMTGVSPDKRPHCTLAESPIWNGSSPKVKWTSLGRTVVNNNFWYYINEFFIMH